MEGDEKKGDEDSSEDNVGKKPSDSQVGGKKNDKSKRTSTKVRKNKPEHEVDNEPIGSQAEQKRKDRSGRTSNEVRKKKHKLGLDQDVNGSQAKKKRKDRSRRTNNEVGKKKPKLGLDQDANISLVENKRTDMSKRTSSEVHEKKTVSIGRGCNVNDRHTKQLQSLLALMGENKNLLQVTNNMDDVLGRPDSSIGLYLEWAKKEDRYFLWGTIEKGIQIKFEFDGGLQEIANQTSLKNPVLVFSKEFACDSLWGEVQHLLEKLFEDPKGKGISGRNDFLLAFTRTGELLHCRTFKILNHAASDVLDREVEKVWEAFILKPLEIHHLVQQNDSTCYKKTTVFLDDEKVLFEKHLFNDSSRGGLMSHNMLPPGSYEVLLPPPSRNSELFGFNTSCEEFFERYHVFRKRQVPGTGPDPNPPPTQVDDLDPNPTTPVDDTTCPAEKLTKSQRKKERQAVANPDPTLLAAPVKLSKSQRKKKKRADANPDPTPLAATAVEYAQLTVPMKVFCRGLIKYVVDILNMGSCLSDFTEKHVFMRRKKVAILGVKLQQYSEGQAKNNCREVRRIITERMGDTVLDDVSATLKFLKEKDLVSCYDLMVNSVAWMRAIERNHMVADLYEDFMEHLVADSQVAVMKNVAGMEGWLDKFKKNWLIYANICYNFPPKALVSTEGMSRFLLFKADELQKYPPDPKMDLLVLNTEEEPKLALYQGRTYFGNIRHLYTHLSDTSRKRKKMGALSDELKDFVVSSEFAAALQSLQVQVPSGFLGSNDKMDSKRASYRRFAQYFCSVESIEFDSDDEK